ncbi:MAG: fatty acid desaturase [Alphaproteobacteria bacterium]|nr:fatty acid desaturase [Alphaproteobacteria bacterium]
MPTARAAGPGFRPDFPGLRRRLRRELPLRRGTDLLLLLLTLPAFTALLAAALTGGLPWGAYVGMQGVILFLVITLDHDAIHGAAHDDPRVNDAIGVVCSLMLGGSFRMHRKQHLRHHARPMQPGDVERWQMPRAPRSSPLHWVEGLLRGVSFELYCHAAAWAEGGAMRARSVAILAVITALAWASPTLVLLGWASPLAVALLLFWVLGSYLPHGVLGIGTETRWDLVARPWVRAVTLGHEDHHFLPGYPFYQWPALSRRLWEARREAG